MPMLGIFFLLHGPYGELIKGCSTSRWPWRPLPGHALFTKRSGQCRRFSTLDFVASIQLRDNNLNPWAICIFGHSIKYFLEGISYDARERLSIHITEHVTWPQSHRLLLVMAITLNLDGYHLDNSYDHNHCDQG